MKTPTINSRILKLEVLKDTATRTSVNEEIQDAVSTHNTATDSHADIRTLIADRALIVHQHPRTDLPWISDPGAALLTSESASAQRTALGMTAWAVAPWTDGTTSDIPEGTQLYFTNARADARIAAQKGQAEGLAPLDAGGKVPTANLPDSIAQADDAARLGGQLPSYYAQASHTHTFDGLTSKPTTLAGYGITDAAAASHTHSGYETAIGNPSANGYLLSSTSAGVRSWVAPYSHPATHAQSVIDSSSGWITTALAGKQAAGDYAAAADAVSSAATGLGRVGNQPGNSATTTAQAWADLPVGYARQLNADIGTEGGLPTATWYYFQKIANRDSAGGWCGIALRLGSPVAYLGKGSASELPSWDQIHTAASSPSLTALQALSGTSGLLRKTAANTWSLDTKNYAETEQGTWTPRITNGAKASGSDADATYVDAKYVRNGNLVTVTLGCVFANKVEYSVSDIKQIYIYGIPFVMSGGPSGMAWMANTYGTCVLGGAPTNGYVVVGSSYVAIGPGSSWPLLVNGQSIYFTITYVKA